VTADDVEKLVFKLESLGRFKLYINKGQRYAHIHNWEVHQRIDNKSKNRVPMPDAPESSSLPRKNYESFGENPLAHAPAHPRREDMDMDMDVEIPPYPPSGGMGLGHVRDDENPTPPGLPSGGPQAPSLAPEPTGEAKTRPDPQSATATRIDAERSRDRLLGEGPGIYVDELRQRLGTVVPMLRPSESRDLAAVLAAVGDRSMSELEQWLRYNLARWVRLTEDKRDFQGGYKPKAFGGWLTANGSREPKPTTYPARASPPEQPESGVAVVATKDQEALWDEFDSAMAAKTL
jgi:hypothetical protein